MRLFFDVVRHQSNSYDFQGRELSSAEDAAQIAELIATDLACSETNDWVGSQVRVRNTDGDALFAVPLLAAA